MTRYQAHDGQEDRHGEMTGAITINMILSMMPVGVWCFFLGPWLVGFRTVLVVALLMAVILPIACLPLSRWVWSLLSEWAERV